MEYEDEFQEELHAASDVLDVACYKNDVAELVAYVAQPHDQDLPYLSFGALVYAMQKFMIGDSIATSKITPEILSSLIAKLNQYTPIDKQHADARQMLVQFFNFVKADESKFFKICRQTGSFYESYDLNNFGKICKDHFAGFSALTSHGLDAKEYDTEDGIFLKELESNVAKFGVQFAEEVYTFLATHKTMPKKYQGFIDQQLLDTQYIKLNNSLMRRVNLERAENLEHRGVIFNNAVVRFLARHFDFLNRFFVNRHINKLAKREIRKLPLMQQIAEIIKQKTNKTKLDNHQHLEIR